MRGKPNVKRPIMSQQRINSGAGIKPGLSILNTPATLSRS